MNGSSVSIGNTGSGNGFYLSSNTLIDNGLNNQYMVLKFFYSFSFKLNLHFLNDI